MKEYIKNIIIETAFAVFLLLIGLIVSTLTLSEISRDLTWLDYLLMSMLAVGFIYTFGRVLSAILWPVMVKAVMSIHSKVVK